MRQTEYKKKTMKTNQIQKRTFEVYLIEIYNLQTTKTKYALILDDIFFLYWYHHGTNTCCSKNIFIHNKLTYTSYIYYLIPRNISMNSIHVLDDFCDTI